MLRILLLFMILLMNIMVAVYLNLYIHFKKLSILNPDGIICVSNNTKKDLFKFYPNLEKQKVVTIYNGVSNNFFKIKNVKKIKGRKFKDLSKKIILFVGDRRKNYKNFFLAVDTVNALKDFVLVSVGGEKITKKGTRLY